MKRSESRDEYGLSFKEHAILLEFKHRIRLRPLCMYILIHSHLSGSVIHTIPTDRPENIIICPRTFTVPGISLLVQTPTSIHRSTKISCTWIEIIIALGVSLTHFDKVFNLFGNIVAKVRQALPKICSTSKPMVMTTTMEAWRYTLKQRKWWIRKNRCQLTLQ